MRVLAVDVGTGTQDILLFDSRYSVENSLKLVMPSPTLRVAQEVQAATRQGVGIVLTGVIMGGGPCAWAVEKHLKAGLPVWSTPSAARTFNDDLDEVAAMGITLVSEDEAARLADARPIIMGDFHLPTIEGALRAFGVEPDIDALALAVFDHGDSPPGYSDRRFRFDYLRERLAEGAGLSGFAFWADHIPPRFTRLQALADSVPSGLPTLVMDTGPAAVLGALDDLRVRDAASRGAIVANIGNFHSLAFHIVGSRIVGLFEHHTGELTPMELAAYLDKLAEGTITNEEVFADMGHGALVLEAAPRPDFIAVTGPRRSHLRGTGLDVYLAVPHGDMMMAGPFGMLRALASLDDTTGAEIAAVLDGQVAPESLW
ncbi:MAG: DUF1786 domain-containing protein [Anaerolineae bacterium]